MLNKIKKLSFNKNNIKNIPEEPGVYIFFSELKPLYVGKSKNLKNRLTSYMNLNLLPKTSKMISITKYFSFILVSSEIESLILEANLINKLKPTYNIQLKDDKSPIYICITNDKYPMVITKRKPNKNNNIKYYFGPFTSIKSAKNILYHLRKIIPFSQHKPNKKVCLYHQMNLCNPCPSLIEKTDNLRQKSILIKQYKKNIINVKNFLYGNMSNLKKSLLDNINFLIKNEKFEEASIIKKKLDYLNFITNKSFSDNDYIENPNLIEDIREKELYDLKSIIRNYLILKNIKRIECYDISHLSGIYPTASMVTFNNGNPDRNLYKHFILRNNHKGDDISGMSEIAKRRIKHFNDWGKPDLILVDGGKAQIKAFLNEFNDTNIPILGIVKKTEKLIIPYKNSYKIINLKGPSLLLIQRLRNEAHRFSRVLHHKLFKKYLIKNNI